ncbi:hypothetical protein KL86CLO1_11947 [uncultured Eubacteriales bacterium]|uniref:Uncharacterized protein n=1 Tax=uncultured Eubacteriales bacterium TaxID=172733 RepID=A0A212JZE8_9FIRM|nr:hypothetical protein KL86CLO1_11947 [uncultured Eubacteriales bacterium]
MRHFKCKAPKLATAELVQQDFGHTLGVHLAAGDEETPSLRGLLQEIVAVGDALLVFCPGRYLQLVPRLNRGGIALRKGLHQVAAQCLRVHDIVLHRAGKGQVKAGLWILKLRPEDTGSIQQIEGRVHCHPLFATGHAGLVPRLSGLAPRDLIDKGGLAHVGDAYHHGTHRAAHLTLGAPLLDLLLQGELDNGRELVHSPALLRIGFHHRPAFAFKPLAPDPVSGGVGLVSPVEDDKAGLVPHQAVNIRVAAGNGYPGIDDFGHDIHKLQVLGNHPLRLLHMPREPLDVHLFTAFRQISQIHAGIIIHNIWTEKKALALVLVKKETVLRTVSFSGLDFLFDLGALAHAVAQIVEFRAANLAVTHQLDALNGRSMDGKYLLHADAVRYAANGDSLADAAVLLGNDGTLKNLDTLAAAFLDLDMDTDGVADLGNGGLGLEVLFVESLHEIHLLFLLIIGVHADHSKAAPLGATAAEDHPFLRLKYDTIRIPCLQATFALFSSFRPVERSGEPHCRHQQGEVGPGDP